jgi:hypothetical protein
MAIAMLLLDFDRYGYLANVLRRCFRLSCTNVVG